MAMQKKTKKQTTKQKAEAFINWTVMDKKGKPTKVKGSQALYSNEYTSAGEQWLLGLLEKRKGEEFEITLTATIRSSDKGELIVEAKDII